MGNGIAWPEARIARLKILHKEGHSHVDIAKK